MEEEGDDDEEDEENEIEDNRIQTSDSVLLTAVTTQEEQSELQVWVLSHDPADDSAFYLHHDIVLPEMPLCLAWMDIPPFLQTTASAENTAQTGLGNYVAIGTFSPAIEIWNLDVLDPLEPTAVLGGVAETTEAKKKHKKKKGTKQYKEGSHEGAVLSLHWNAMYRQALASGSADSTVKIWDVTTHKCMATKTHHQDKVQCESERDDGH